MPWQNAPALNKLAAAQLNNKNGAQIWGVDHTGKLHTCYQETPGGEWSKWLGPDWAGAGYPKQVYELCASQEIGGGAQLWVLDENRKLWTIQQDSRGNWSKWQNDWNRPPGTFKFKKMAAVSMGRPMTRFWAITEDGILVSCDQSMPLGVWGAWSDWPNTPKDNTVDPPEPSVGSKSQRARRATGEARCGRSTRRCSSGAWGRSRRAASGGRGSGRTGWAP